MQGLQDLKYSPDENTPEELAKNYKEDGNFNFSGCEPKCLARSGQPQSKGYVVDADKQNATIVSELGTIRCTSGYRGDTAHASCALSTNGNSSFEFRGCTEHECKSLSGDRLGYRVVNGGVSECHYRQWFGAD